MNSFGEVAFGISLLFLEKWVILEGEKKHFLPKARKKKTMLWLNLYTGLCTNRKIIRKLEITEEK